MSQASTSGISRNAVSDPFFGTAAAAAYLNYSESHFRALVRAGKVPPPLRINSKLLWRQSLLDQYMHALAVKQGVIAAA
jgi:predicted DNA-binding transcriptional regulator AlpA